VESLEGFQWDAANVEHILRHNVTPFEVEDAVRRPHLVFPAAAVRAEQRWKLLGKTSSNRYLVVVFTVRGRMFRTVTAYEMNVVERRKYAAQIG
jgi:uncharacterized DUF497 family protein